MTSTAPRAVSAGRAQRLSEPGSGTGGDDRRLLYRVGAIAAVALAVITILHSLVFSVVVSVPVVLSLYSALRPTSASLMGVYVAISIIGVVAFTVARPAFEMLSLSNGYAAAASEAERAAHLAAATATYAAFHGTAFWVSYLLGSLGGPVLSAVILRGTVFSRRTAYVRIASSVFDLGCSCPASAC